MKELTSWQKEVIQERDELQQKIFNLQEAMESPQGNFSKIIQDLHKRTEFIKKEVGQKF